MTETDAQVVEFVRELDNPNTYACLVKRDDGRFFEISSVTIRGTGPETLVFNAREDGSREDSHELRSVSGRGEWDRSKAIAALAAYHDAIKAKAEDIGTYVDGHWGQYATAHMIEKATQWGWHSEEAEDYAARHLASIGPSTEPGITDDEHEAMNYAADDAESWLNEHTLPADANFSWRWEDGEFGLWLDETDDE